MTLLKIKTFGCRLLKELDIKKVDCGKHGVLSKWIYLNLDRALMM